MEYYIYHIPVFVITEAPPSICVPTFCEEIEELIPVTLLNNIEVVYIGEFKELEDRNASYMNGAIYMTAAEPTNFDMIENFVHETAHSLEAEYGMLLYTDDLRNEFLGKRKRLKHILASQGYHINPLLYDFTEYNEKFDEFLATEVGYSVLVPLTMGLFVSPYGATSLQEYFANGFEKYILDDPRRVQTISPVLYEKIEEIIDEQA